MSGPQGTLVAVCTSGGGIPKLPLEAGVVGELGLEGDGHRHLLHGGRDRAVCLLSDEEVHALERDGVPRLEPGAFGENLRTRGLDLGSLPPGARLAVGDEVVLEVHDVREPCAVLKSIDRRFPDLMIGRSGLLCRVLTGGTLRPGLALRVLST